MQKNYYDEYIEEYIYYYFQDMRNPFVPRDTKLEQKIMQASKANYILSLEANQDQRLKAYDYSYTSFFFKANELPFLVSTPYLMIYCKERDNNLGQALQALDKKIQDFDERSQKVTKHEFDSLAKKLCSLSEQYRTLNKAMNKDGLPELAKNIRLLLDKSVVTFPMGYISLVQNKSYTAFFSDCSGVVIYKTYLHYFQNKKIQIPLVKSITPYNKYDYFHFDPFYIDAPLFNLFFISQRSEAFVILTDSIELAKKNQNFLNKEGITDIVWTSWDGGLDAIEKVDWTHLKGRKIYYLLKEHSDMGTRQVYNMALAVNEKLSKEGCQVLTYISLLPDPMIYDSQSMQISHSPKIWSNKVFKEYATSGFTRQPYNYDLYFLQKQQLLETGRETTIFKPFIHTRNVSLLYGTSSAKTWLAVSIAAAIKHGGRLWEACEATDIGSVLYIHGKMSKSKFQERLKKMEKQYNDKKEKCGIINFYSIPEEIGDGNTSISSDIQLLSHQLQNFHAENGQYPSLIVLDSLTYLERLRSTPGRKTELNVFLKSIKASGCAILIIHTIKNVNEAGFKQWKKDLDIDATVKISKKEPLLPERVAISMSITSGLRDNKSIKYQHIELEPEADIPQWRLITTERSKEEEKYLVNRLLIRGGLEYNEIAQKLNISVDDVKRRTAELRDEYKQHVLSAAKDGLHEYQIGIKFNLAPRIVGRIIQKGKNK